VSDVKVNGIAIFQGNKRFRAYWLLSTEPRALASGLLQAAWRPLANARGSVPGRAPRGLPSSTFKAHRAGTGPKL
jgi:hypothetical protein